MAYFQYPNWYADFEPRAPSAEQNRMDNKLDELTSLVRQLAQPHHHEMVTTEFPWEPYQQQQSYNHYANTDTPDWMDQFQQDAEPEPELEPSLEDLVKQMVANDIQFQRITEANLQNLETQVAQLATTISELNSQCHDQPKEQEHSEGDMNTLLIKFPTVIASENVLACADCDRNRELSEYIDKHFEIHACSNDDNIVSDACVSMDIARHSLENFTHAISIDDDIPIPVSFEYTTVSNSENVVCIVENPEMHDHASAEKLMSDSELNVPSDSEDPVSENPFFNPLNFIREVGNSDPEFAHSVSTCTESFPCANSAVSKSEIPTFPISAILEPTEVDLVARNTISETTFIVDSTYTELLIEFPEIVKFDDEFKCAECHILGKLCAVCAEIDACLNGSNPNDADSKKVVHVPATSISLNSVVSSSSFPSLISFDFSTSISHPLHVDFVAGIETPPSTILELKPLPNLRVNFIVSKFEHSTCVLRVVALNFVLHTDPPSTVLICTLMKPNKYDGEPPHDGRKDELAITIWDPEILLDPNEEEPIRIWDPGINKAILMNKWPLIKGVVPSLFSSMVGHTFSFRLLF